MKKSKLLFAILITASLVILPQLVFAQNAIQNIKAGIDLSAQEAQIPTGPASPDLTTLIGQLINYLFGIIGALFLVIVIIGGISWMAAGGNEERVGRAKKIIVAGFQGIIILFFSYAIVYFIIFVLDRAANFSA